MSAYTVLADKMVFIKSHGRRIRKVPPSQAPRIDMINLMLSKCKNQNEELLILVGWNLALRSLEIAGLKVHDFDFIHKTAFIREEASKGNYSSGYIPIISNKFMDRIKRFIEAKNLGNDDYLLNYTKHRTPYTTRHLRRMAKSIGTRAGMPEFHTHMLRHSMARWLIEAGHNLSFVKDFLRHTSIQMTVDLYGQFELKDRLRQAQEGRQPIFVYDNRDSPES